MEVESVPNSLRKRLNLVQAADFFGMELITFHKKHHLFFSFFIKDGGVEMVYLMKHFIETSGSILLKAEYDYEVCHPERCCRSGETFCRSVAMRRTLLDGMDHAKERGIKVNDSFLWNWVCTSGRNCCLLNSVTFEYTLFTLVRDELITFKMSSDGTRDYEIAPPKRNKVGRPRKYF